MRKEERIAAIRVFYDLIMADTVIDAGEMHYFSILQDEFGFSKQEELQAKSMTLAEAIKILSESDMTVRQSILDHCNDLSVSDGFCARSEALLIIALTSTLGKSANSAEVFSVPKQIFNIPDSCVLYIESEHNAEIEDKIKRCYRSLFSEFKLAGFEFIYIPHVIKHYIETSDELIKQIFSFVSPGLSESGLNASIDKFRSMTTVEFTKDILCNKLEMEMMRDTSPSFLIKIGTSFVDDAIYSNYLKINIEPNIENFVFGFIDRFTSMLSTDVIVVSSNKEQDNQFFYTGFYKLLIDAHILKKNVRSRVYINPYKEEIYFPDIDTVLFGLHRKEKALYLTILILSDSDGISFNQPTSTAQLQSYNKNVDNIKKLYSTIYGIFGGSKDKVPDLSMPEIRNPMFSVIKRHLGKLSTNLYNINDYQISKDSAGCYRINIEQDLIYLMDINTGNYMPLKDFLCQLKFKI